MLGSARTLMAQVDDTVLRWPTPRSRNWVGALLKSAKTDPNIVSVVAVGSAVRPVVPSTDIDLVVICNDPNSVRGLARPLEVDLRAYSVTDTDALVESGHDMLGWAVKFGRVLFQRDHSWDRIVESWRHRLPLPSPEVARQRAAAAFQHLSIVFKFGDMDAAQEQAIAYLTHLARAELIEMGVYPASRPELAGQLRAAGNPELADWLDRVLRCESPELLQVDQMLKMTA